MRVFGFPPRRAAGAIADPPGTAADAEAAAAVAARRAALRDENLRARNLPDGRGGGLTYAQKQAVKAYEQDVKRELTEQKGFDVLLATETTALEASNQSREESRDTLAAIFDDVLTAPGGEFAAAFARGEPAALRGVGPAVSARRRFDLVNSDPLYEDVNHFVSDRLSGRHV